MIRATRASTDPAAALWEAVVRPELRAPWLPGALPAEEGAAVELTLPFPAPPQRGTVSYVQDGRTLAWRDADGVGTWLHVIATPEGARYEVDVQGVRSLRLRARLLLGWRRALARAPVR